MFDTANLNVERLSHASMPIAISISSGWTSCG